MAKIREKDKTAILNALAGGVTPRQGIQHIQVGRKEEVAAIIKDLEHVEQGGGAFRAIVASFGSGKSVDNDTPILTEDGFHPMGDIRVGDKVYTRNGTLTEVTHVFPQGECDVYEVVLEDGRSVKCNKDHLWIVNSSTTRPPAQERVFTTQEMIEKGIIVGNGRNRRFQIPYPQAIQYPERQLSVPPYVMGYAIGDGCLKEAAFGISTHVNDVDNIKRIASLLETSDYKQRDSSHTWYFYTDNPKYMTEKQCKKIQNKALFADFPELLTGAENKKIPDIYMRGSIEQRWELLRGLMDSDGTGHLGRLLFTTVSKQLAQQVLELVRSLGYTGNIGIDHRADKYPHSDRKAYNVSIWASGDGEKFFHLERKKQQIRDYLSNRKINRRIRNSAGVSIVAINKLDYKAPMTCITVADDSASYICGDYVVTHNTFFLTLAKTIAEKRNFVTICTDFAPDRRLYSTNGFALNLYRAEIRSLSTPLHPEGGALEELLDAIDEKVISGGNTDFLNEIRRLPYGFDAVTVCNKWHQANNPITEKEKRDAFFLKDACLRWFSAEATQENKKMLQVRSLISDDGCWDMLKTIAMLSKFAGYSGLLVELDEAVNLFRIANTQSREKNLEALLRILNECLQGDAKYIDVILASAPEILDPRRGAFSYAALRTRLASSEYADKADGVDVSGPMINLLPLSNEDQLMLLTNVTNVFALGDESKWLATQEQMQDFLVQQYSTLGAEENKTPRDITRAWVMLLRMMDEDPTLLFEDIVGQVDSTPEKKTSGLGAALDTATPNNSALGNMLDDDDDFGF